ncbi:MAG: potassium channel protein [Saprospirales bacterium]|nr:potassium channel protein [Saprospirales bacterium]MBK8920773.1 potassium channel protein [Saprospirales bacterium]
MFPANYVHFILLFFHLPDVRHRRRFRFRRMVQTIQRLRLAIGLAIFALAFGTVGYVVIEGFSWFDAYYMAVITLASVGFSEVHPLSDAGRLFTTFYILFNVGLFAYSISTITGIFAEGGFNKLINEFRMNRKIEALSDHTIVCGYGRHATEVAQELGKQGIPFVVIENRHDRVEQLRHQTDHLFIEGDATDDDVLEEAGIHRAGALVVTLPSDADNLFITLSARQINPKLRIISRANNLADEIKIRRAGADHTVVPEQIGGFYMATLVNKPDLVEFFTLLSNMGPSNVVFEEIEVRQLHPDLQGKTIQESGLHALGRVSVVALRYPNGQYELNPPASAVLRSDWHIVVLGNAEQMRHFRQFALISPSDKG